MMWGKDQIARFNENVVCSGQIILKKSKKFND